jgi:hypothetical protein
MMTEKNLRKKTCLKMVRHFQLIRIYQQANALIHRNKDSPSVKASQKKRQRNPEVELYLEIE